MHTHPLRPKRNQGRSKLRAVLEDFVSTEVRRGIWTRILEVRSLSSHYCVYVFEKNPCVLYFLKPLSAFANGIQIEIWFNTEDLSSTLYLYVKA